jgi:hypothetical protein
MNTAALTVDLHGSAEGQAASAREARLATALPIPLVFGKGIFDSGVAAQLLAQYAEDPLPHLDSELKKKMAAACRMMWFKFEELAFDAPAKAHWRGARSEQADNIDVGPVTEADLRDDFFASSGNPF